MALRELSSLEKFVGLKRQKKISTQGERKVPVLQNNNGSSLIGLVTISSHLELNEYLVDKVYLAGNSITLADALMYYGIHHIISELAVQQKEKYLNVTRWFDHIQHYPGVRHHLPPVIVLRNRVYQSNQH
ncbi:eukaryotic translation elongation factor 1 epsilon-1 isoform X4 [Silurus meridionalis]|uniref:eukaryotic translation elongation factor 1 epsilon-1 isoform X4 n=1 Tax=Silurus meridionalis TaxID=175797 RepID=UPI001EEC83A9|nr:eukaryotic translation elongation factor 1 epsilon-1 isoform X4 [Silurus meridionalis]